MLRIDPPGVKPCRLPRPREACQFARRARRGADCGLACPGAAFLTPILALLATLAVVLVLVLLLHRRRRGGERQRALGQLLDAADGLEARLRDARAEIEAIAGSDGNPVRDAMQEMLRQRLWLQQHGGDASLDQLRSVRDSIEAARRRIEQQLVQIERARAPLA
ncbi:hypothetical protein GCM10027564_00410 [Luteimonas notoginsengisoli]